MKRVIAIALVAAACGGGGSSQTGDDGGTTGDDAAGGSNGSGMPPAPALGPQLDRMGRPGVAELLIASLPADAATADATATAYRQASDATAWATTELRPGRTIEAELMAHLAILDAFDFGLATSTQSGCNNTLGFDTPVGATSYRRLADLLADDQIYLDTARATCTVDLALEIELLHGTPLHTTCGGRTLGYDALDVLTSIVLAGSDGLDLTSQEAPRIRGTATAHADISDTFPFLGAPNP